MGKEYSFGATRKPPKASLSITSLMDVLTIILIFLLVNYSDVVETADLPKFIDLPKIQTSEAQTGETKKQAVVMSVGIKQIQINNDLIKFRSFESEKDTILQKISQKLGKIKQAEEKEGRKVAISFQASKEIEYSTIDEIIVAAAAEGITNFDFMALRVQK